MTSPRVRRSLLTVAAVVSAIALTSAPASADPTPTNITHVRVASLILDLTPDGSLALIYEAASNEYSVVDMSSGGATVVGGEGRLTDDGAARWAVGNSNDLIKETIGAGDETFANPLEGVVGDWIVADVVDVRGSRPVLFATDGSAGATGYFEFDPVTRSAQPSSFGGPSTSANGEWSTFTSFSDDEIPGLTGTGPRLFVEHVPSGLVALVPAEGDSNEWQATVSNDGRVFFRSPATTLQGPGSTDTFEGDQLFAWDGSGAPVQLTRPPGGLLPTGPLTSLAEYTSYQVTPDGQTAAVTTFAENLDGERGGFDARLYRIDLPARGDVNDDAIVAPNEKYCVGVYGAEPGDFVVVNVTPILAGTAGFATIHSSDDAAGDTSSANFGAGTVDPNVAFSEVGADGRVCVTNSKHGPAHVVLDQLVVGSADVLSSPTAAGADRLGDTRDHTPVLPLDTRCFAANGAPGTLTGVNVTPVLATAAGFGVIHSSDESAGSTSNVNFGPGSLDPNVAFARIGADGQICFTNSKHGVVDVIVDQLVNGQSTAFSSPTDDGATRLIDTREGSDGPLRPNESVCVSPAGTSPGDWTGLNITPVEATGPGFGTMHSSDVEPGGTSNVNFGVGTVDPNVAFVEVGADGTVCFSNSRLSSTHVIIDQLVNSTPEAFSTPTPGGAKRLADTRLARF